MDRIDEKVMDNQDEIEVNNQDESHLYPMSGIKVDKGFYSVFELKRRYDSEDKRIILDSDFQREDVWNSERKAELVESVLMGLPLPIFYFNQDKYGRLIVIDGRQRLTALFEYMNGKYALMKLKVLSGENKKKFNDLSPLLQSRIEDYQIQAHVIMPPTPDRLKFDIFDRVNRGGMQLNKQEIRNALYQGEATKLLRELSESSAFIEATDKAFLKEKRMKDKYLLSRFIAVYLLRKKELKDENGNIYSYSDDIDDLLGKTMDYLNTVDSERIQEIKELVLSTLEKSLFYCGKDAFRLMRYERKTPINMNVFETIMYCLSFVEKKDVTLRETVFQSIQELITSSEYHENIGNHRDNGMKLVWRLDRAEEIGMRYKE